MSASGLDDTAMTSSSAVTSDVKQVLRLTGAKSNSRYFGFRWRKRNSEEFNTTRKSNVDDLSSDNLSNSTISNGFLMNIKKRWRMKNLGLCKAKQKIIAIDTQRDNVDNQALSLREERPRSFADERNSNDSNERAIVAESDVSLPNEIDEFSQNCEADTCWERYSSSANTRTEIETALSWEKTSKSELGLGDRMCSHEEENNPSNKNGNETTVVQSGNVAERQSTNARASIGPSDSIIEAQIANDGKAKVNLPEELLKLSKYGWYWGPMSGDEADSKLVSEPDGAFLVRDSSDDRYLLTLSFKSSGRLLHARMEHNGGLFSLCNQTDNEGYTSVAALIHHSMNSSQSAVFCYSRPRYPGYPSFPVRLTKPVSRFTQVRTLQYLCRFVIRQNTRLDNIHKLPLPKTITRYIEEAHY